VRMLRYPGGSSSDDYNWQTNQSQLKCSPPERPILTRSPHRPWRSGRRFVITTNYGTGTPQEAAPG